MRCVAIASRSYAAARQPITQAALLSSSRTQFSRAFAHPRDVALPVFRCATPEKVGRIGNKCGPAVSLERNVQCVRPDTVRKNDQRHDRDAASVVHAGRFDRVRLSASTLTDIPPHRYAPLRDFPRQQADSQYVPSCGNSRSLTLGQSAKLISASIEHHRT